jgi:hypothetical protein
VEIKTSHTTSRLGLFAVTAQLFPNCALGTSFNMSKLQAVHHEKSGRQNYFKASLNEIGRDVHLNVV